jgi:hypothetical protein
LVFFWFSFVFSLFMAAAASTKIGKELNVI